MPSGEISHIGSCFSPRKLAAAKKRKKKMDTNLASVVYLACHSHSCLSGASQHVFYSFRLLGGVKSGVSTVD